MKIDIVEDNICFKVIPNSYGSLTQSIAMTYLNKILRYISPEFEYA